MTGSTVSFRVTVRRESVVTFRGHLRSSRWTGKGSQSLLIAFLKSEFKTLESRRASDGV